MACRGRIILNVQMKKLRFTEVLKKPAKGHKANKTEELRCNAALIQGPVCWAPSPGFTMFRSKPGKAPLPRNVYGLITCCQYILNSKLCHYPILSLCSMYSPLHSK